MRGAVGDGRGHLAVLGGSSPFTVALVDALAEVRTGIPPQHLVLQGRNLRNAELVRRYAARRLSPVGWSVSIQALPELAIEGAWLIVHQNRYGGTEGRREDEQVAARFAIAPDETLGPAALHGFLHTLQPLRETAALLARSEAWVLNLTNPLSLTTSVLADGGVSRCVGLCELPLVTARRAAARLDVPFDAVAWAHVGFNHRGFIVELREGGIDRIPELATRVVEGEFEGIPGVEIGRLRAIPTKYFRLFLGRRMSDGARAAEVATLRERSLRELEQDPSRFPATLRERYMEWYPQSVVPAIAALSADQESEHVLNLPGRDGLTREVHAAVSRSGIRQHLPPERGRGVAHHLARFEEHERAVLDVARHPGQGTLTRAVELDPLVPPERAKAVADYLGQIFLSRSARSLTKSTDE